MLTVLNLLLRHSYLDLLMNDPEIFEEFLRLCSVYTYIIVLYSASGYSVMKALYKLYNHYYYYYYTTFNNN